MPDGLLLYNNIDYSLLRQDRIDGNKSGGVCAFIRNFFSFLKLTYLRNLTGMKFFAMTF